MDTMAKLTAALVVITGINVVVTAVYAYFTKGMLRTNEDALAEMRAEREAARRPYIAIATFTLPHDVQIYLRIENTGKTSAKDLRLSLDRPFHFHGDARPEFNLQTRPAFSQVLGSFGPGTRLVYTLATSYEIFGDQPVAKDLLPRVFHVTATYSWNGGRAEETEVIDLHAYDRSHTEPDATIEEMQRLRKALNK